MRRRAGLCDLREFMVVEMKEGCYTGKKRFCRELNHGGGRMITREKIRRMAGYSFSRGEEMCIRDRHRGRAGKGRPSYRDGTEAGQMCIRDRHKRGQVQL